MEVERRVSTGLDVDSESPHRLAGDAIGHPVGAGDDLLELEAAVVVAADGVALFACRGVGESTEMDLHALRGLRPAGLGAPRDATEQTGGASALDLEDRSALRRRRRSRSR